jgi:hypothetical protein
VVGYAVTVKIRGSAPPFAGENYLELASARLPTARCGISRRPKKIGFQLFAGSTSVSHAYVHIVEFGTPVEIGGLKIQSGDLLHGDQHGVQSIPETLPADSAGGGENRAEEQALIKLCQSSGLLHGKTPGRRRQKPRLTHRILHVPFCHPLSLFDHRALPDHLRGGVTSLVRMPVDLFPPIKIPVVVVATFYSGMPPEQIENDITGQFERMFTLAPGHRPHGVALADGREPDQSLFSARLQSGFDVTSIANLAMASLRYLPPGTLPPIVMQFDASSLPVCLVTLKGEGLSEAQLRDLGQFTSATRWRACRAPRCRRPSADGIARSWCMWTRSNWRRTVERHGRGAQRERSQPDSAGRRRENRALRLQRLCQQPDQRHEGHQPGAAENGRGSLGAGGRRGQGPGRLANPVQQSARQRPGLGVSCRS